MKRSLPEPPSANADERARAKKIRLSERVVEQAAVSQADDDDTVFRQIWEQIKDFKDTSGQLLSGDFMALPSRKMYPDYYVVIKEPVSLAMVRDKIERGDYEDSKQFVEHMSLIFDNAMAYNIEGSAIYEAARALKAFLLERSKTLLLQKKLQKPKPAKYCAQDARRLFAGMSQGKMDVFDEISKMPGFNANQLFETGIFDNKFKWTPLHCASFYGQAKMVTRLMDLGANLDQQDTLYGGRALAWAAFGNRPEVCRLLIGQYGADVTVQNSNGQVPADLVASPHDPMWKGIFDRVSRQEPRDEGLLLAMRSIYEELVAFGGKDGRRHSEFFLELPKPHELPGYFEIIKHPRSFAEIKKRLHTSGYASMDEFHDDVSLIFQNAQHYNASNSLAYNDSKALETKFAILLDNLPESYKVKRKQKRISLKLSVSPEESADEEAPKVVLKIKPPKVKIRLPSVASTLSLADSVKESAVTNSAIADEEAKKADSAPKDQTSFNVHQPPAVPQPLLNAVVEMVVPQPSEIPCFVNSLEVQAAADEQAVVRFFPVPGVQASCMSVPSSLQNARVVLQFSSLGGQIPQAAPLSHHLPFKVAAFNGRRIQSTPITQNSGADSLRFDVNLDIGANVFEFACCGRLRHALLLITDSEQAERVYGPQLDRDIRQVFRIVLMRM